MILVTFLLDRGGEVASWAVQIKAATMDTEFMHKLRGVTYDLVVQGATILRIEVNDKGTQVFTNVGEVLA